MSAAQVKALRALVQPIAEGLDCDLEDITVRMAGKRRLVRIVLDHDDGLPLDLVAAASRQISTALDESAVLGESPFVLEVTSPGVDRPLRHPRHWRRARGRLVAVTLQDGRELTGRVLASDESGVTLQLDSGQPDSGQPDSGQPDSGQAGSGQADSGHAADGQSAVRQGTDGQIRVEYPTVRKAVVQVEFRRIEDVDLEDLEDDGPADEGPADEGPADEGPTDGSAEESPARGEVG